MTPFEILTIIGSALLVFGGLIAIYVKTVISIAKIQVEIVELRRDLTEKEIAILKIERDSRADAKENREAHGKILEKVDTLVNHFIKL